MQTELTAVVLLSILIGFDHRSVAANKCTLQVETGNFDVSLPAQNCGQSSVTVNSVTRGHCINNGDNCQNMHWRHTEALYEQCCIAKTATDVTGTVTVTGSGCSESVTYRFTNVTECQCKYLKKSTLAEYTEL